MAADLSSREAAAEGIEAVKLEASLYSSVIGATNMIVLQYAIDSLTPTLLPKLVQELLLRGTLRYQAVFLSL